MTPSSKKWSCPPKIFFHFLQKCCFLKKKLLNEKIFKTSFSIRKVIPIYFRRHTPRSLQKRLAPQKRFLPLFQKILLFLKKLLNNKIFSSYVNFWRKTLPFPKKLSNVFPKQFFTVFLENTLFFRKNCWVKKYSASNFW